MTLTCPNCGNTQNFLVKTLQVHVVQLGETQVNVTDEGRPGVVEMLCDECDTPVDFETIDDALRKEVLLTLGAR